MQQKTFFALFKSAPCSSYRGASAGALYCRSLAPSVIQPIPLCKINAVIAGRAKEGTKNRCTYRYILNSCVIGLRAVSQLFVGTDLEYTVPKDKKATTVAVLLVKSETHPQAVVHSSSEELFTGFVIM